MGVVCATSAVVTEWRSVVPVGESRMEFRSRCYRKIIPVEYLLVKVAKYERSPSISDLKEIRVAPARLLWENTFR